MSREVSNEASFRTLGLSPEASWDEVKSAFRMLARRYHPDVAGPSGARKFAEITQAYMTLKDEIAPGAASSPRRASAQSWSDESVSAPKPSLWRRLVGKFFGSFAGGGRAESAKDDFEFSPARERFVESIVARAEAQMHALLARRDELKNRSHVDGFTKRIRSKHPSVVLLALQQLTIRGMNDELRRVIVEHFQKNIPASEIIAPLLALFGAGESSALLARSLARHVANLSASDALQILRWMKRQRMDKGIAGPYLKHGSPDVVAAALSHWDLQPGIPDAADVTSLLKRSEEPILVPLLRILRREGAPLWSAPYVDELSKNHPSSVVRVWASSIVREQKIG